MQKRYICFTCYSFHPEMKGVSKEEFNAGDTVCKQEKCARRGEKLESAYLCETCSVLYPVNTRHSHTV